MKSNPLIVALVALLALGALSSVVLAWQYVRYAGQMRVLQTQAESVNRNRAVVQALAKDAVEYSAQNPAIDPILQQFGLKQKQAAAPASKSRN